MAETEMINLDTLNVKQRLKEYKATQKDVKSKDLVAKGAALKKLTDIRYLTEGGCFFPLVSSILPKKVSKTKVLIAICLCVITLPICSKNLENLGCIQIVP